MTTGDGVGTTGVDEAPPSDQALTLLAQLGEQVEGGGPLPGLVRPLLEMLGELSGLEVVYLTSIDWEAGLQTVEIVRNETDWPVTEGQRHAWHDSLCEMSMEEERPWNTDVQGTWGDRGTARAFPIQSFVSVPVEVDPDGLPYGTLCGASPRAVDADPRVVAVLRLFANMIATSLQRDRALEQARARAEYAEARLADRIRFAAQVEHAMKSPITVIKGWAETLRDRAPDDLEARTMGLDAIESTADRLAGQVEDLLAEARSAIGAGEVEDVDVRRVALALAKLAPEHPYVVRGSLHLQAEPVAVSVLLEHLVENAVTHTPPGTPIRVLLLDDAIVVEDDGPGLPDRDDLFAPFVSADPDVAGTGLGLHIIASIAERLGAEVTAGSADSGGARFELSF